MRNRDTLISMKGITKVYGKGQAEIVALKGIDIEIKRGEFLAIMGASGSGKSTFLNILGCLDEPSSGSYWFEDLEVTRLDRNQKAVLRRYKIGFVFQSYNLLPRTSALENVELPLIYRKLSSKERKKVALKALDVVGLSGWERHTPSELSGGQQQRVAIARAIVTSPELLLADEPTGNLDTEKSHEIISLIRTLNEERGLTIVMVTHEPDMAEYAERKIRFVDGRISSDEVVI
ncbi:MAG: ABC transporter ATP-binding protein [Desulfatiglandales bacterium]